jgi:hypothetical protein
MTGSLIQSLREKAGDGSTDYFVEVRQSDLLALLDPCLLAGRHVCGPQDEQLRSDLRLLASETYDEGIAERLREMANRV